MVQTTRNFELLGQKTGFCLKPFWSIVKKQNKTKKKKKKKKHFDQSVDAILEDVSVAETNVWC